jgi:uncharacterized surface anchored protein
MKKRISSMLVTLLLMVNVLFGGAALPVFADSPGSVTGDVYGSVYGGVSGTVYGPPIVKLALPENIITKVTLKDKDGNVIDAVYNPGQNLEIGGAVHLIYDWELPNGHGYKAGDTFTFHLPPQFAIYNDIAGNLLDGEGQLVGTFTVDMAGQVVMTFTDYVETHSNISGQLQVKTEFRTEVIQGSTEIVIKIPVTSGEQIIIVHLEPPVSSPLDKSGEYVDGSPERIDWSIELNKKLEYVKQAKVSDTIPAGLQLLPDTIQVYNLQVNVDGTTVRGAPLDASDYTVQTDANGFTVTFNGEGIVNAYEVVYSTDIVGDQTSFTNNAELTGENIAKLTASATVTVNRGLLLDKTVDKDNSDYEKGIIAWLIRYNYSKDHISADDAELTDVFGTGSELVPNSLQVFIGTGPELLPDTQYTVTLTADGFKLKFKNDVDSPYTIKYKTQLKERVIGQVNVTNKVWAKTGESDRKTVTINDKIVIKDNAKNTNYKDKTNEWKITLNADAKPDGTKYTMEHVVVEDTFTNGGLEFLPGTLVITSGSMTLILDTDYTVDDSNPREGFTIQFLTPLTDTVVITYRTKFDLDWKTNNDTIKNVAKVTWQENGTPKERSDYGTFEPDRFTKNNGEKRGSYDPVNKIVTWEIWANYNLDTFPNAKVTDVVQPGQQFVDGSLIVYLTELTGPSHYIMKVKKLIEGTDYTVDKPSESNGNTLTISFAYTIDDPYWISFQTSLEEQLIEPQVKNTAELWSDGVKKAEWPATLSIPNGGKYVSKSGKQNGNKIDWTIKINESQSYVSNAKIEDTPSLNQILIPDSFRLFAAKPGTTEKDPTAELVKDVDYDLVFTTVPTPDGDQEKFVLSFKHPISRAYVLEYQSFINAGDKDKVKNSVTFSGEQVKTEIVPTTTEIIVRVSSGSGSGSGVTGSLEVTKVDKDDPAKVLEGAKFVLYDAAEKRPPMVQTTNAEGKALFTNLLYDNYILKELSAPDGYEIDTAETPVTIDSSVTADPGKTKRIVVTNTKKIVPPPVGGLEVVKVDKDDTAKVLKGAKFKLTAKADSGDTRIVTTNEQGIAAFDKLPYGDYTLEEIEAPAGYVLSDAKLDVTIGSTETVKIVFTNVKQPSEPGDPGEPGNPGEPNNPGNPDEPGSPDEPETPVNPDDPIVPTTPSPNNPTVDIPDEETPRGGVPPADKPTNPDLPPPEAIDRTNPTIDIPDEPTPKGGVEPKSGTGGDVQTLPKTGEPSRLPYYLTGAALIGLGIYARRRSAKTK